jgi:hypothetical protein
MTKQLGERGCGKSPGREENRPSAAEAAFILLRLWHG